LVNFKPKKDEYFDPVTCRFKLINNVTSCGANNNSDRIISTGNTQASWDFSCNDGVWSMKQEDQQKIIDYRQNIIDKKKQRERRERLYEERVLRHSIMLENKKNQRKLKRKLERDRKKKMLLRLKNRNIDERKKRGRRDMEQQVIIEKNVLITKKINKERDILRQCELKKGISRPKEYFYSKIGDKYYKETCSVSWCKNKIWFEKKFQYGEDLAMFKYKYFGQCSQCGEDAYIYIVRDQNE